MGIIERLSQRIAAKYKPFDNRPTLRVPLTLTMKYNEKLILLAKRLATDIEYQNKILTRIIYSQYGTNR